ncbi:MAG: hypothetical protein AAF298_15115, partial [Cyanobacteria bacterium P01_A01_bin.40]
IYMIVFHDDNHFSCCEMIDISDSPLAKTSNLNCFILSPIALRISQRQEKINLAELSAIKLAQEICTHGLEEHTPDSLQKACEELRRIL